ncbi:MAG: hypothetical protein HYR72_13645 [Deltaproteobacteria bacterium]|nr:hypothetical protein [Deltaproteobacteria bacterium]MBI3391181.1 hypothetical protein [Deltaproteobacteria bacterium]
MAQSVGLQCVVAALVIWGGGVGVVSATERRTIDLRQGNNLKIIFDAGLRPWRTRGLEDSSCGVFHEEPLTIVLPSGEQIEIDIERAHFTVLAGNALNAADFFGVTEPVSRAVERVRSICGAVGLSDEGLAHCE